MALCFNNLRFNYVTISSNTDISHSWSSHFEKIKKKLTSTEKNADSLVINANETKNLQLPAVKTTSVPKRLIHILKLRTKYVANSHKENVLEIRHDILFSTCILLTHFKNIFSLSITVSDTFLEINWFTSALLVLLFLFCWLFSGINTFIVYGQKHDDNDDDKSASNVCS